MKKFGRRTVLQLNEKKTEKKPEKPIGLSGLVQYGNDNSESEEEEESEVSVTPTQMPASPAEQNGKVDQSPVEVNQATVEVNQAPVEKKDHMDTQLADFLAEIESISKDETESEEAEGSTSHVETAAADSTSATPHTSKQITPATSSGESETDEEEEPAPDVEKPTEPKSAWQHCLDEGTEHYYYWNTVTNQVTWEIPEDYSKYLLLLKEYEERLTKYEKVMREWEERKNQPKEKKKKRKGVTNGAASPTENEERPKPLVDYKIETPEVKPNVELVTNKYGRGLGFSPDEGQVTPYAPRHRATYPVSFVKGGTVTNKLPELIPKVSKSESSGSQSRNVGKSDRSSPAPVIPPPSEATRKDSNKSDNEEEMSDQENEPVQGPQLPTFPSASRSSEVSCNGKEKDAPVESKPESDMEIEDFDLDDIDRQLELALEKKMDGKSKKKRRLDDDSKEDADATKKKRTNDASLPAGPLQPRPPAQPPADKVNKKKILQEDLKLRAEVDEFARDISDKLDSLEVSRKSMTQLQILLIETETRISDWRDGGIESGFMLKKLQDAGKQLKRYESTAAPPGWSCHWDRTYKRYYYFHNTTGESSWEYPEDEAKDNVTSSQVPAPPSHHPGQHLGHSTVQAPPPPSTTPINRDQPIHFAGLTAAPPPPPPSHPAPPSAAPFPDSTAPAPSSYVLPLGLTNPPPPPSSSPPPTPPGTSPPPPDGAPGDTDTHDAQNEVTEDDDDGNVISAAPQIRQNIDLNDGQSLDGMPIADAPAAEVDDLPTHSTAAPTASSASQSSASALPELSSSAAGAAKEKKKKKKLGTGLAMKKKGVGNLVQKWQQIQEEVATKQKD